MVKFKEALLRTLLLRQGLSEIALLLRGEEEDSPQELCRALCKAHPVLFVEVAMESNNPNIARFCLQEMTGRLTQEERAVLDRIEAS